MPDTRVETVVTNEDLLYGLLETAVRSSFVHPAMHLKDVLKSDANIRRLWDEVLRCMAPVEVTALQKELQEARSRAEYISRLRDPNPRESDC